MQRIGARLAEIAGPAGWSEGASELSAAVVSGSPALVRILSDVPEVHALPWELLPLPGGGGLLGELPGGLVHGTWPGTATAPQRAVSPSSGALLAWSAAGGAVPEVVLTEALRKAPVFRGFSPGRDVLPDASLSTLARALTNAEQEGRPYAALVLLCHVLPDESGCAALALSAPGGGVAVVEAEDLRHALRPFASSLRLVTLLLCEGSEPGPHGRRCVELALGLHRAGHRAVLGLRFPLSVRAICAWSLAFFAQLKHIERDLVSATLRGRAALATDERGADWAAPLLLARSADLQAAEEASGPRPPSSARRAIGVGVALLGVGAAVALWGLSGDGPVGDGEGPLSRLQAPPPPESLPVAVALISVSREAGVSPIRLREALLERDFTPCLKDAPPPARTGVVGRILWVQEDEDAGDLWIPVAVGPGEGIEDCVLERLSGLNAEALGGQGRLGMGLAVIPSSSKWVRGEVPVRLQAGGGSYGRMKRADVDAAIQAAHAALEACLTQPGVDAFTPVGDPMGRQVTADWRLELEIGADGAITEARIPRWTTVEPPPPCLLEQVRELRFPPPESPQSLSISLENAASADPSLR
ncbi:MAG: CHAT domain-containing protein [Alphaproteobacteria bacterium]|nr:CHAT domain-containing protein [Alphaproteobacteria bacterium]MCB9793384.1 CHAT domain-containing protein [Alphaproteobacteria bacterium]